ncbi:conjugal transfer protein TraN [Desulfovibrio sp. OttesenSCG-928-C14]|nr:conjugal transfer protein TraN [Desulfovibrio sp. OttesenSCG-928-C14]
MSAQIRNEHRETDERCTIKVFGACLQKKNVYCCFDSVLARIIHEQGRPQLGLGWGSCRGFYLDEFMQIDFTRIDFSEYVDDLTRQMLNPAQVESKVRNLVEKYASELGGDDR